MQPKTNTHSYVPWTLPQPRSMQSAAPSAELSEMSLGFEESVYKDLGHVFGNSDMTKSSSSSQTLKEISRPLEKETIASVKLPSYHALSGSTSRQQLGLQTSVSNDRVSSPGSSKTSRASTAKDSRPLIFKLPLTPQETLRQFKTLLTPHEQTEILGFKDIYFTGSASIYKIGSSKRKTGAELAELYNLDGTSKDRDAAAYNHGFDDSRGDLYLTKHDHIAYRYEILSLLGKGSFGQVIKCFDHKRKTHVALKIIRNKTRFEKQGLVEVKVLNKLADADHSHSNCLVHVLSNFFFRGHLCFTFELLGINLYEWLKAGNFRGVHLGVVQRLSYQMLQCLQLLERLSIIHCDLKPENILLCDPDNTQPSKSDSNPFEVTIVSQSSYRNMSRIPPDFDPLKKTYDIKVIDFGSSCYESERLYTYVQSRFYRSPEVILGAPYSTAIDIWSFGCILAEMLMGYPLFPGENEQEQLHCIMELRGLPPSSFVSKGTRASVFFDANGSPRPFTNTKGKRRRPGTKTLGSVLKCSDMAFLDFLDKCLEWEPEKRLKPLEALQHPFITGERFIPKPVHPTSASSRSNRTVDAEGLTASSSKYIPQVNSDYMTPLSANTLQRYGQARAAYYGTEYTGKSLPNVFPTRKSTDAPRTLDKAKSFGYRPPQQTDPDDVLPPITNASPQRTKRLSLGTFLRRKSPKDKRTSENVQ